MSSSDAICVDIGRALRDASDLDGRLSLVDTALKKLRDASFDSPTPAVDLCQLVASTLELPVNWADEAWIEDPTRALVEAQWRAYGNSALALTLRLLRMVPTVEMDSTARLNLFVACARFCGDETDPWITPLSSSLANDCIRLLSPDLPLVQQVLLEYMRPIFLSRPHTSVNPVSGRALARPRGGPGYADFTSSQDWKGSVKGAMGSWNVLAACLSRLELTDLESCWHLLVPPLLAIMEDHEIPFRVRGIRCMLILLATADASLLKRTGLDRLLSQSLTTSLTFLSFPEHAPLIAAALPAYLALIDRMHPRIGELSEARFDALCALMREGPLAIWTYAIDRPAMVRACVDFVPRLFAELGLTTVRFLDSLIPPLSYILRFPGLTADLHTATANALSSLVQTVQLAGALLKRWRGTILAAVGMCEAQIKDRNEILSLALRKVVIALTAACPAEIEIDLLRLRSNAHAPVALQQLFAQS